MSWPEPTSPEDLSRAALVADATFVIDELALAPVVVVGQSFGGTIAMLLAADRPRLVRGLVLVEAGPDAADEEEISEVAEYLNGWPLPFANRLEAERFFGGSPLHAKRWADGLRDCPDGLRPRFEPDVAIAALRQAARRSYWNEWSTIACPILVVSAGDGMLPSAELDRMASTNRNASFRRIEDAGHDLHLDAAAAWALILEEFVGSCAR